MADIYAELKGRAFKLFKNRNLLAGRVRIQARGLSAQEAIGNPEADDFPLQKGKERLMQADFWMHRDRHLPTDTAILRAPLKKF